MCQASLISRVYDVNNSSELSVLAFLFKSAFLHFTFTNPKPHCKMRLVRLGFTYNYQKITQFKPTTCTLAFNLVQVCSCFVDVTLS